MKNLDAAEHDTKPSAISLDEHASYRTELSSASNQHALKNTLHAIVKRLGFSDYSVMNLHCTAEPQYQLSSLPAAMLDAYFEQRLFTDDMVLQRALNRPEPFFSSLVYDHVHRAPYRCKMTQTMAAIDALNCSFGYFESYHIPYKTHNRYLMLSLVAKGVSPLDCKRLVNAAKQRLDALMDAIAFVLRADFTDMLPVRYQGLPMTPKPLLVLNTLANNDMTIEQVAEKLGISVVTANQHLKTMRTKLGVKSNYACIRYCIAAGLITFDET